MNSEMKLILDEIVKGYFQGKDLEVLILKAKRENKIKGLEKLLFN